MAPTVLIAVADEEVLNSLVEHLHSDGFQLHLAHDGHKALAIYKAIRPDLVLVDAALPKPPGIEVCAELRRHSNVPIVMLDSSGTDNDPAVGLEAGADDYVTDPSRVREVAARLRAVLRRAAAQSADQHADGDTIEVGEVRLYRARHEVTVAGRQVTLSPRQFGLLEVLMEHGGHAVTRAELMARVWSTEEPCRAETVNIHMRRLRARLRLGSSQPSLIKVVRGRGYALALPEGDPPHVDSQVPPPRRPHGVSRAARSSMSDSGPPVPGRAGRPASVNGSSGYDLCAHCALAERGANPRAVARLATGYVLLNPTQHYRGATTFVAKDCVTAIHDLPELARSAHLIEMAQVAEAVSAAAGTGRLDYEAASHTGPHLHWWLTPRGSDDPHPATAIWQNPDFLHCYWVGPTLRAGHELKATKTRLLEALKQRDVTIEYSYL